MIAKSAVITEWDFDRLSDLVRSARWRAVYGSLLARLEQELGRGRMVDPARVPRNVVTMNSRVRIRNIGADERAETYTLVYPPDADIELGRLSVLAPLGTALLGARVGDGLVVNAPAGPRPIRVERILYQPEAAGDFHL